MKRIEVVARILSQLKILGDVCRDAKILTEESERLGLLMDEVSDPPQAILGSVDTILVKTSKVPYHPIGCRIDFEAGIIGYGWASFSLVSTFFGTVIENANRVICSDPDLVKAIIDFLESEAEGFDPAQFKIKTKEPEFRVLTREFPDAMVNTISQTGEMAPFVRGITVDLHFCDDEEVPRHAEVFNKNHDTYYAEVGLTFDGKTLVEYDGAFELPKELVTSLTELGYTIDIGK